MSATPQPATILIAGGGIVGLALAMSIKKQLGIVPEIYEKTSTFATEAGAALGMYPVSLLHRNDHVDSVFIFSRVASARS